MSIAEAIVILGSIFGGLVVLILLFAAIMIWIDR